ncbi:MAG: MFS transporter [Clostridiaceae bacterium]
MQKEKKNMLYLVSSKGISRFGDIMFDFANNTFLAGISPHSMSLVGIYQALENIIGVLFNLFGGVIADNFRRKKIIVLTNICSGIACILLSFINKDTWLIYAVVVTNVILAFLSSFSAPTYKAFTKEIVEKQNISKINSYLETISTIIKVTVPIIAIFLYGKIGVHGVLLLDGISFLIAALLIFLIIPINEEILKNDKNSLLNIFTDLVQGFKYLVSHKQICIIIILSALVNFFLAAYNLLLPYSNQMFVNLSDGLYGIFLAAEAIGGLLGAIVSSFVNKELSIKKLMFYLGLSGLMLSIAPLLYIVFHRAIILAISPALFNLFLTIFNIHFFSFVQRDVDNEFIGRIFGIIFTVAIIFMPIGTGVFTILLNPEMLFNFSIIGIAVMMLSLVFLVLLKIQCHLVKENL